MAYYADSWYTGGGTGYSLLSGKMPRLNSIRRVVNREGFRALTELADTLIGAAAGSAASATHKRVGAQTEGNVAATLAGNRTIETVTDISRNSTAQDVTDLKAFLFNITTRPTSYPRDLSGNGGPAY